MAIIQRLAAGASSLLSLFLSRSAAFRKAWALTLAILGLAILGLVAYFCVPSPFVPEEIDEKSVQTRARISFSNPQVFSRQSLINDRLKEGQFLDDLLTKSADVQFQSQLRRDLATITSISAQLGITANSGAKLDFERSKQLDDIKQEIELTKLRAELRRVQRLYESLQSGTGTGPAAPSSTTTGQAASQTIDQSAVKAQLDSVVSRAKDTLDQLTKLASGSPRQAGETQSPEDRFKDLQVYRAALRSASNAAKGDDMHDRDGNALYRMQFIVTVFPGTSETRRQWGIARVEVIPPLLRRGDIERLYLRWLVHSTVRLNTVDRKGCNMLDPHYESLVNGNAMIGLMALTPNIYDPTKAKPEETKSKETKPKDLECISEPLFIATNPEQVHMVKWLLLGKRYMELAGITHRLKQYIMKDPRGSASFNNRLGEALKRDRRNQTCKFFENSELQEIFLQARDVARASPFLIAGLQSARIIQTQTDLLRQTLERQGQEGQVATQNDVDTRNGVELLQGAADVAGDILWVVEQLYREPGLKACRPNLMALQEEERKVEVPCSFLSAITTDSMVGSRLCSKVAMIEDSNTTSVSHRFADPPSEFKPHGKSIVYSVTPTEQAQRVSTAASAANSAQMALALAAGLPSSGVGAQGGVDHLQSAVGNADALERLPLVIAFSDQGSETKNKGSRFGWVFGPQSYIKAPAKGDPKIGLRQMVSAHQVAVEISVPVWWPKFDLQLATAWVSNVWKAPDDYLDAATEHNTQRLEVNRPISMGDLDSLTGYLLRAFPPYGIRPVRIDRVEPSLIPLCGTDNDVTLLIYGLNLWRNPEAYLLGRKAREIHILPDMQGIAANFTLSELKKDPNFKRSLVVWTQSGPAEFMVELQTRKENCPGQSTSAQAGSR